ncbi:MULTISPECIES: FAD-binding oxidoreductase [Rhodococcus]|uniref:Putative FAD-linked oxidase n=1 Tax=Rhodococcus wratislaviensis NBRC 100605 TaxID=1219028 RepID=X0PUX0_RHOWR|nr:MULTISPECIES: FAD-linked oxidase C-terminal domain-containing protein [Rhodococcus]WAM16924.1 FAD-binding protein [Rhodococcus sp. JS3073]GAF46999.1 putative FAD-linked oxidase [Rhodococcus wratislaviensis NBRC 100605]
MNLIETLKELVPADIVVTDPDTMEGYRRDSADLVAAGKPIAVLRPRTTAQVSSIMTWATQTDTVVVPRGAGTGLSGGATALDNCVVVSMERMNSIREFDATNHTAVVEAGVVNADVGRAVADAGLFYPPDPGSFEVSTIGGNLATNAGGMRCVKYGVTRNSVLGLEVVLADGRVLRTGGKTVKNVAGLDLTQLFVGSEGALGIITSATLRLRPTPAATATFVASFPTLDAGGRALNSIFAAGVTPSMLEIMDNATINAVENYQRMDLDRDAALLVIGQADGADALDQVDRMVACCDEAGADLSVSTSDPAESEMLLQARRLAGWATMEQFPTIIEDVGVPRTRLAELLSTIADISEDTGIRIATVGHAGDGNVHPMLLLPDLGVDARNRAMVTADRICAAALALDGTITGEHGVGELKREWLTRQLDDVSLGVQASIKRALDPKMLLNPGRGF